MDKQFKIWIKECKSRGFDKRDVCKCLLEKGIDDNTIDDVCKYYDKSNHNVLRKMAFGFIICIIAFIVLSFTPTHIGMNIRTYTSQNILSMIYAQGVDLNPSSDLNSINLNPYYFNGEYSWYATGNESKIINDVLFINHYYNVTYDSIDKNEKPIKIIKIVYNYTEAKIVMKQVVDRTYEECIKYDAKSIDNKCLETKEVVYNVPVLMLVKDSSNSLITTINKQVSVTSDEYFSMKLNPFIHEYKVGYGTLYIIEDVSVDAVIQDVVPENNFTHLNISDTAPYDSLVLYMPFDDNISAAQTYDYTENNLDGAIVSAVYSAIGKEGYGNDYRFVGDNDYILVTDSAILDFAEGFTICVWFDNDDSDALETFVSKYDTTSGDGYALGQTSDGSGLMMFRVWVDGSEAKLRSDGSITKSGGYRHACGVRNATGTMFLYRDSVLQSNTNISAGAVDSDGDLRIGVLFTTFTGDDYDGNLDEVMIFNTALTSEQISAIYNGQAARFKTSGNAIYRKAITPGNSTINITSYVEELQGSGINLTLSYYASGSWTTSGTQQVTSLIPNEFTTSATATNISLNYTFTAGANQFYSPIMKESISLEPLVGGGDTTLPIITINMPQNTTYTEANMTFNVSINEAGLCNYSLDGGLTNLTMDNVGNQYFNASNASMPNAQYTATYFCRDSALNLNSTSVVFVINYTAPDIIKPIITINMPQNTTYTEANMTFNVSINEAGLCNYSLDGGLTNLTMDNVGNQYFNASNASMPNAQYNVTYYCEDLVGNEDSDDVVFVIDYTALDTNPPEFSGNFTSTNPIIYNPNTRYEFNITWIDETLFDTAILELNVTNYTMTNSGNNYSYIFVDGLRVGDYPYRFFGNDSSGNWNSTSSLIFSITKNTTQTSLTFDVASPQDYLTAITPTCSFIIGTGSLDLTNGTSGSPETLGAGAWNINCSYTGDENYTSSSNLSVYTINQIASQTSLVFNASSPRVYRTSFIPTCSVIAGENATTLYLNGTSIVNETAQTLRPATYTLECNYTGTQNYTASTNLTTYTINKGSLLGSLASTKGWTYDYDHTATTISLTETNTGDGDVTYIVYRDSVNKGTGEEVDLEVGTYNYILNSTGGENWTLNISIDAETLTINQVVANVNAYINGSRADFNRNNNTIDYLTGIMLNATFETGYGDIELWLNGSQINNSLNTAINVSNLIIGYYNVSAIFDGNVNYSANQETWWINISAWVYTIPPTYIYRIGTCPENIFGYYNAKLPHIRRCT